MLSFAACDSATDPLVDRVDAELLFLSVRESAIRSTHGFAAFESALPLAERALRQGEAVLVRLSSSRGDAETLRLVAPTPVTIEGAPKFWGRPIQRNGAFGVEIVKELR